MGRLDYRIPNALYHRVPPAKQACIQTQSPFTETLESIE